MSYLVKNEQAYLSHLSTCKNTENQQKDLKGTDGYHKKKKQQMLDQNPAKQTHQNSHIIFVIHQFSFPWHNKPWQSK